MASRLSGETTRGERVEIILLTTWRVSCRARRRASTTSEAAPASYGSCAGKRATYASVGTNPAPPRTKRLPPLTGPGGLGAGERGEGGYGKLSFVVVVAVVCCLVHTPAAHC